MTQITENEFKKLVDFVKGNYGINLSQKKILIIGRLQNYLMQNNFKSFSDYYDFMISDKTGKAVTILINKLTTNHTFFMREADHFEYYRDKILPYIAISEAKRKDLRIWSAGCSSGEEPYTLAMINSDYFAREKSLWDTKILATDISTNVLDSAIKGIYPNEGINSIPVNWRTNYFKKLNEEESIIDERIKSDVIFRRLNLMDPIFPFKKKFHVIFCRNVMIYFDSKTKDELINKFYELTETGGYLFIGHSESLNREGMKYRYIMPAVYRKE